MIKCLECGFEANRLQWTHFKFNCTGKFSNSKEYATAYPGTPLVDPNISKKSAITLDNLVKKYGKEDGYIRWERYKEKQAKSNTFEYKNEKFGWSREQFDNYNSSRAQTLENMINRYGESEGAIRWMNYCERQAYTNTLNYFIEKYGRREGTKKYKQVGIGKSSAKNPQILAEKMNISVDEAIEIILSKQRFSGAVWGSDIEREFTTHLQTALGESLEYTTFTKPYGRWVHSLDSYVIYDIKHKDFVIEFNGDYWHANPLLYKDDAIIRGKTAKHIQKRDETKIKEAINLGLRVFTVWESEYRKDREQTISRVIEWIQNGQK